MTRPLRRSSLSFTTLLVPLALASCGGGRSDLSPAELSFDDAAPGKAQGVCTPAATRCVSRGASSARERCDETGGAWVADECSDSQRCVATEAGATCVTPSCSLDAAPECSPDGSAVVICAIVGSRPQSIASSCGVGQACFSGTCRETPLAAGSLVTLGASDSPISLPAGSYGLAIVDTSTTSDAVIPFPVALGGDVTKSIVVPPAAPRAVPRPSFRCNQAEIEHALTELGARSWVGSPPKPPRATYEIGDTRTFNFPNVSDGSLTLERREGTLRKASSGANYWEDTTKHGVGTLISDGALDELAERLDSGVIPRDVGIFGPFTDVDGNGKLDVFFTERIAEVNPSTLAFVFPATLVPPGVYADTTDYGEVIYVSESETSPGPLASAMAHELQHLIYYGQQWGPYLDDFSNAPVSNADAYAIEGIANLAGAWSGQDHAWFSAYALSAMGEWSAARLFSDRYVDDVEAGAALYGYAGLFFEYLFDRAGAVKVAGQGDVIDRGGVELVRRFQTSPSGKGRLVPLDDEGATFADGHTQFAGALLASAFPTALSASTRADPRFRFVTPKRDLTWGGLIGGAPDGGENGRVRALPWSSRGGTMRAGGMGIFSTRVTGAAELTISRASTRVVVLRH